MLQLRVEDPDVDDVAATRTRVRAWADAEGLAPAIAEIVLLAVSELVTNAIRHAPPGFELTLSAAPGCIELQVFDAGSNLPVLAAPDIDAVSGRGLQIVSNVADRWGTRPLRWRGVDGKVVWAHFDTDSGPSV
jgi:anti-sigma regulatory factor (Ser/Thr protein kinase)